MLFVELRFFLFFAVVLAVYWSLRFKDPARTNDWRKWFILCASYYFYGSWDKRFAVMLCVISTADWWFALRIAQRTGDDPDSLRVRKLFVTLSVAMNLSVLGFFKYFHFFVNSAVAAARAAHVQLDEPTLRIILPVGVSFFTFQSSLTPSMCIAARFPQSTACATT